MKINVELTREEYKQALLNYIHDKSKIAPTVDIDLNKVFFYETVEDCGTIATVEVEYEI